MGGVGEEEKHNQRILYNFLIKMKSKTIPNDLNGLKQSINLLN